RRRLNAGELRQVLEHRAQHRPAFGAERRAAAGRAGVFVDEDAHAGIIVLPLAASRSHGANASAKPRSRKRQPQAAKKPWQPAPRLLTLGEDKSAARRARRPSRANLSPPDYVGTVNFGGRIRRV